MTSVFPGRFLAGVSVILALACCLSAQGFLAELNAERDPNRRADMALAFAFDAFDSARDGYLRGNTEQGDSQLDNMTKALNVCVDSLEATHKSRSFKKPELRVSYLQRRMKALLDDIELPRRGWAEQMSRKLDEIHDKLLAGALRK